MLWTENVIDYFLGSITIHNTKLLTKDYITNYSFTLCDNYKIEYVWGRACQWGVGNICGYI